MNSVVSWRTYVDSALRQLSLQHLDVVVVESAACRGASLGRQNNRGAERIQREEDAEQAA
jgi:hypothetical protein